MPEYKTSIAEQYSVIRDKGDRIPAYLDVHELGGLALLADARGVHPADLLDEVVGRYVDDHVKEIIKNRDEA